MAGNNNEKNPDSSTGPEDSSQSTERIRTTDTGSSNISSSSLGTSQQNEEFMGVSYSPERILQKQIEEVNKKVDIAKKDIESLTEELTNQKNSLLLEVRDDKDRLIQTLAVFVGLFTFVSVNFQFFSNDNLTSQHFLALDLVLGGFLIIFVFLLRFLTQNQMTWKSKENILGFISIMFIFAGYIVLSTSNGNNNQKQEFNNTQQISPHAITSPTIFITPKVQQGHEEVSEHEAN